MADKKSITVKNISRDLWNAVRGAAALAGKSIPEFVEQALKQAVNGKGK